MNRKERLFLVIYAFILAGCSATQYKLDSTLIFESDQYHWNRFRSLQMVSMKEIPSPLGMQTKPILMFESIHANDTGINSTRLVQFQVVIPTRKDNIIENVFAQIEPAWTEHSGNQILATAKSLQDQIFGICKTRQTTEENHAYYSSIELQMMKVDLDKYKVDVTASINWIDTQREPRYNASGDLIGWTEAANLTSKILNSPFFSAVELNRDFESLHMLVRSDQSIKLVSFNLKTLEFQDKAVLSPYVEGASESDRPVGKLHVERNGTCYVILEVDRHHKAAFEKFHDISLTIPVASNSISVLLAYYKGKQLFILPLTMEQCENAVHFHSLDVYENKVALIGKCETVQGVTSPGLQVLEFESTHALDHLVLRRKTSATVPSESRIVTSLKWFDSDTLITTGEIKDSTTETAFLALINAETGILVYTDEWTRHTYNIAYDIEALPDKHPTEFYHLAMQNESVSKAAVFQLKIINLNISTPWAVLASVIGFAVGFVLIFAAGKLVWQRRNAIDKQFLLASHPKTKQYMNNLFNSFKNRKRSSKRPLLGEEYS